MNKLIKELTKQAGINLTPAQFSGVLEDEVCEFELEKLAELIVCECIETLGTFENTITFEEQMNLLKKHFGIKQ